MSQRRVSITRLWLVTLCLMGALLTACGSDSTVTLPATDGDQVDTDTGEKDLEVTLPETETEAEGGSDGDVEAESETPAETEAEVEAEVETEAEAELEPEPEAEPESDTPAAGLGYRADTLTLFSPEMSLAFGGQTIDAKARINQTVESQIANEQLNLLIVPITGTPLTFPYRARLSFGTTSGNGYAEGLEYSYEFTLKADGNTAGRFNSDTVSSIEIPISQADGQIFTLRDAVLSGTYATDISTIDSGILGGAVSDDDASNFIVYSMSGRDITLKELFTLMKLSPDYTFSDGSKGYKFIFKYTAQRASIY